MRFRRSLAKLGAPSGTQAHATLPLPFRGGERTRQSMPTMRALRRAIQRRANAVATGVTAALLLAVLLQSNAAAATTVTISLDAAGLSYNSKTTHLIFGISPCPTLPLTTTPTEHNGAVEQGGGYVGNLMIPQGARITGFRLSAEDNDGDTAVYAYLARKKLTNQSGNFLSGYKVLATVQTSDHAGIRRVGTSTIASSLVDNTQYAYFVELVNCASTVNPVGLQVVYSK